MPMICADGLESFVENPSENFIWLVLTAGLILIGFVAFIGGSWYRLRKTEARNDRARNVGRRNRARAFRRDRPFQA